MSAVPRHWRNVLAALAFAPVVLGVAVAARADVGQGWQAYEQGDYATALEIWTDTAKQGDAVAQYNVGVLYDEGAGVGRDVAAALDWWTKAADQGHLMAQHNLAMLLIEEGGTQNLRKAAYWLKRASAEEFYRSQYSLAKLYSEGLGVEQDINRSLYLFLRSAIKALISENFSPFPRSPAEMAAFRGPFRPTNMQTRPETPRVRATRAVAPRTSLRADPTVGVQGFWSLN